MATDANGFPVPAQTSPDFSASEMRFLQSQGYRFTPVYGAGGSGASMLTATDSATVAGTVPADAVSPTTPPAVGPTTSALIHPDAGTWRLLTYVVALALIAYAIAEYRNG